MVCGSSSVNINHVQGGSVDFTWSVGGEFYSVGLERGEGVWILRANVPAGWLRIESVEIWREVTARYFLSCKDSKELGKKS